MDKQASGNINDGNWPMDFQNEWKYMLNTYLLHELSAATEMFRITCYGANANAIATCFMCFQWLLNIFLYKILTTESARDHEER